MLLLHPCSILRVLWGLDPGGDGRGLDMRGREENVD